MKKKIKKFKHHWGVMVVLILIVFVLSYSLRVNNLNNFNYVLKDIDELVLLSLIDIPFDDQVEVEKGSGTTKIYVKSKESLEMTYSIAEDIIKSNQNDIMYVEGPNIEIYFGDYVIVYQGFANLQKKNKKGDYVIIKSVSPAGEETVRKIHQLEKMVGIRE